MRFLRGLQYLGPSLRLAGFDERVERVRETEALVRFERRLANHAFPTRQAQLLSQPDPRGDLLERVRVVFELAAQIAPGLVVRINRRGEIAEGEAELHVRARRRRPA